MSPARIGAVALGATRIVYDLSLLVAPVRVGRPWIGDLAERKAAQMTLRSIAARDIAINAGIVTSAIADAPVRPWLAAAAVGDVADVAATFAAGEDVPADVPAKLVGVGGGSAVLSALVFAWVND